MSEPPREDDTGPRHRAVQRRVLLGTLTLLDLTRAFSDLWGVPLSLFLEALVGIALMIGAAVVLGALLGALLAWLRRR